MQLNEPIEDYLEQILIQQEKRVRAPVDIASSLGATKASVSHATNSLRENSYIVSGRGNASLTPSGYEIAERIYRRHRVLAQFSCASAYLKTAFSDACRMEHDISTETFTAIRRHAEKNWE
ncbi:MAG: metal-dependent transcriptional regulator [Eubacteriales bacterium]